MLKRVGGFAHEIYGYRSLLQQPSLSTLQLVANATSAAASPKANPQNLPQLPVPRLLDTLAKYLASIRPHLNDQEFSVTSALVKQFAANGGPGPKLQSLLEDRAKKHTNWLEDWWVHSAYLDFRWPVVVYSNPGLVFPFRKFANQDDQLKYAAQTILAALDYKLMIDKDEIPVEMMGKAQLDMSQYKKVFGTCRIPGPVRDAQSFNNTNYITVIHKKHIFHVDVFGSDGVMLNEAQTVQQLKQVLLMSQDSCSAPVGILTSENRNTWGNTYQALIKDAENAAHLRDVERSLMVLCLDEEVGLWRATDKHQRQNVAAAQTIHGGGSRSNGANRWFDKTLQLIVGADGVTGLTYEHSPAEGQPIAVLTDFLIDFIDKNKSCGRLASSGVEQPRRLDFKVSPDVEEAIRTAEGNLDKLVEDLELNCFTYEKYGKDFIKSQKLSPDSYLQMAMQYAFYRLHKVAGAHYESAATRMYIGGRTETIRSCSSESVAFARAMLDPNSAPHTKLEAMRAAIKAHKDYTVQALQGLGVDRHLLGLKLIALQNGIELPKLYTDTGFTRSSHMRISTSQVACRCDGFMCYGPLVPDGYATCYNPRPADINFATSAFQSNPETSCTKYRQSLEQSLDDMHDLLLLTTKSKL